MDKTRHHIKKRQSGDGIGRMLARMPVRKQKINAVMSSYVGPLPSLLTRFQGPGTCLCSKKSGQVQLKHQAWSNVQRLVHDHTFINLWMKPSFTF